MPAAETGSASRRSGATTLAFVVWVLAIALVYALMLSRAASGTTTGLARVAFRRTMITAGRSALDEASFALRHHAAGHAPVLKQIHGGSPSGVAFEPALTRDAYKALIEGGRLAVGSVTYAVASRPPSPESTDPWLIDFSVGLGAGVGPAGGLRVTRTVRRRMLARVHRVIQKAGPPHRQGKVVYSELRLLPDAVFEVNVP